MSQGPEIRPPIMRDGKRKLYGVGAYRPISIDYVDELDGVYDLLSGRTVADNLAGTQNRPKPAGVYLLHPLEAHARKYANPIEYLDFQDAVEADDELDEAGVEISLGDLRLIEGGSHGNARLVVATLDPESLAGLNEDRRRVRRILDGVGGIALGQDWQELELVCYLAAIKTEVEISPDFLRSLQRNLPGDDLGLDHVIPHRGARTLRPAA